MDHAELVWRLLDGRTQQQVAEVVGWSRGRVSQYAMLSGICSQAWAVVATTFSEPVADGGKEVVAEDATGVAPRFTEGLLRPLSSLHGSQQHQLVKDLAKGKDRRWRAT